MTEPFSTPLNNPDGAAGSSPWRPGRWLGALTIVIALGLGLGILGSAYYGDRTQPAAVDVDPAGRAFYVSPDGQPMNDGTRASPLDLATALSAGSPARPGDTIWLLGGIYRGAFRSGLKGTSAAPIIVRQAPGVRATIDTAGTNADGLFVNGAYTWYWGFEITSSDPGRHSTQPFAADIKRGSGVTSHAPGARFINLVIHDMVNGLAMWISSPDSEAYGNLIYHNGYDADDRGHGHGIYTQNKTGGRYLIDNILFGGFGHGIHAYGSDAAFLNNIRLEGNVVFDSGVLGSYYQRNILVGGGRRAENPILTRNYTYYSPGKRGGENNVGYAAGCGGLDARHNYWAHMAQYPLNIEANCDGAVRDNVLVGAVNEVTRLRFPDNTYIRSAPTGLNVVVRPNRYEPGRAHVIVYNWDNLPSVPADLSDIGLARGAMFEIVDAQNVFGPPIVKGTYGGGTVQIPVTAADVVRPVGDIPSVPVHTRREFGVFIVRPQVAVDATTSS